MACSSSPLLRALLPIRRCGSGFAANQSGSTIAEFGILAIPFFAIIGAILETSMVFFAGQVLDSAVQDASRRIRTGQAQTAMLNLAGFRDEICDGLYGIFDCSKLKVRVTTLSTFASTDASVSSPIKPSCDPEEDADECWQITETYSPGVGSSIVLVEAYYKWPIIVNFGGFNLANQPDGARLLAAVRVFRNEPFS